MESDTLAVVHVDGELLLNPVPAGHRWPLREPCWGHPASSSIIIKTTANVVCPTLPLRRGTKK